MGYNGADMDGLVSSDGGKSRGWKKSIHGGLYKYSGIKERLCRSFKYRVFTELYLHKFFGKGDSENEKQHR